MHPPKQIFWHTLYNNNDTTTIRKEPVGTAGRPNEGHETQMDEYNQHLDEVRQRILDAKEDEIIDMSVKDMCDMAKINTKAFTALYIMTADEEGIFHTSKRPFGGSANSHISLRFPELCDEGCDDDEDGCGCPENCCCPEDCEEHEHGEDCYGCNDDSYADDDEADITVILASMIECLREIISTIADWEKLVSSTVINNARLLRNTKKHTFTVCWGDGTITMVKASEDEEMNDYHAFTAALAKRILGNNSRIHKIVSTATEVVSRKERRAAAKAAKAAKADEESAEN